MSDARDQDARVMERVWRDRYDQALHEIVQLRAEKQAQFQMLMGCRRWSRSQRLPMAIMLQAAWQMGAIETWFGDEFGDG